MKIKAILGVLIFSSLSCKSTSPAREEGRAPARAVTALHELQIKTVQQFLIYMDLEALHLGTAENGAPGLFIAVPAIATVKAEISPFVPPIPSILPLPPGIGRAPVPTAPPLPPKPEVMVDDIIGYYFKGQTGIRAGDSYDDNKPAFEGTIGSPYGYPCVDDEAHEKALMDVKVINQKIDAVPMTLQPHDLEILFKNSGPLSDDERAARIADASRAKGKLWALRYGFRNVALSRTGVYIDCVYKDSNSTDPDKKAAAEDKANAATSLPDASERRVAIRALEWLPIPGKMVVEPESYAGLDVKVVATWNSGTLTQMDDGFGNSIDVVVDSDGKPLKAESINVINFGNFYWVRHKNGTVKNADKLIQLYRDMGYIY